MNIEVGKAGPEKIQSTKMTLIEKFAKYFNLHEEETDPGTFELINSAPELLSNVRNSALIGQWRARNNHKERLVP